MNPSPNNNLERDIDRALKSLPDLQAPTTLVPGVLARIQSPAPSLAGRQFWQLWPAPVRLVILTMLAGLFVALCWAGRDLFSAIGNSPVAGQVTAWLSGLRVLLNTVGVLLQTCLLLVRSLGWGALYGTFAALALGYAVCVMLGTVYVRLAFARQRI